LLSSLSRRVPRNLSVYEKRKVIKSIETHKTREAAQKKART
jgi:hypothetical protein